MSDIITRLQPVLSRLYIYIFSDLYRLSRLHARTFRGTEIRPSC